STPPPRGCSAGSRDRVPGGEPGAHALAAARLGEDRLHDADAPLGEPALAVGEVHPPEAPEALVVAERRERHALALDVGPRAAGDAGAPPDPVVRGPWVLWLGLGRCSPGLGFAGAAGAWLGGGVTLAAAARGMTTARTGSLTHPDCATRPIGCCVFTSDPNAT